MKFKKLKTQYFKIFFLKFKKRIEQVFQTLVKPRFDNSKKFNLI
jgi:hypothetical protein